MIETRLSLERLAKAWLPLSHSSFVPNLMQEIGPPLARIAVAGVKQGIKEGVSPDGRKYKPLKHKRPSGRGQGPLDDSGALAASVRAAVTQDQLELESTHPAAATHQFGATIRAKRDWLTIPATEEAARAGGARRFPRALFFVASRLANTGLLCERSPNGLRIHYVLKPQVKIDARPFLGFSGKTELEIVKFVADRAADTVAKTIQKAGI